MNYTSGHHEELESGPFPMLVAAITVALVASLAPPPRYDYEPSVPYHVSYLPQERIQRICAKETAARAGVTLGCSLPELGLIYVTEGMQPGVQSVILRHEKAHINGWPSSHRDPFTKAVEVASRKGK